MLASVLAVLGRAREISLAEEIFLRSDLDDASVHVFNAMMGVYARAGQYHDVQKLLEQMKARGIAPDLVSFNTLINAKAKSGRMPTGSAQELLQQIWQSGIRPDAITYNTLLSACSQACNLEDAVFVFRSMVDSKCEQDLWTYNAMISVCGRCGMADRALKMFDELRKKGLLPDAVTYNALLFAFTRDGDVKAMEHICEEMLKAGFKKDEITYNTMIHMYGKKGRLDLAISLYAEMRESGCNPDSVTYTVLIDSLGKADRIGEAGRLMTEMVNSGVRPTLRTFSALICGYAKAGMHEESERTFGLMVRTGIKPDLLAYSVILDVFLRSNGLKKAMVLYREMLDNGFKPDVGLYSLMVRAMSKEGKTEDIEEIVKDMEGVCGMNSIQISSLLIKGSCLEIGAEMLKKAICQGYEPTRKDLFSVVYALLASKMLDEARALLLSLREYAPDSVFLLDEAMILVKCSNRELEAALEDYNRIRSVACCNLSCSVYESLIRCCVEAELFPEACQLFSDLKFSGLQPSESIYRMSISIYCKLGFPETAHHLVDVAEKTGMASNDHAIHLNLIATYGKLKQWRKAEYIVGKLRQHSTVDRKVWNALIYAYAESGLYEQARAIFNTMMKEGPSPSVDSINGLLHSLIVDGRLDELYVVVQELQDMDFKISRSTIIMMLDAFINNGNIFEVKKVYLGMKAAGFLPTMHIYRSMIVLFARGKRVQDVERILSEMGEAGFSPDLTIFNALLILYTSVDDFRKAVDIYQKLQDSEFHANEETFNTLILMYSKDRRIEEAFSMLNDMVKQGMEPKIGVCKSLLVACSKTESWKQAEELFEKMRSNRCILDRSIYHIMMKIYRNAGYHSKAEHVLLLMKDAGVQPTFATMHLLMASYGSGGQPQEAENVLNSLRISGLQLSTLHYSTMIDAYLSNGDYQLGVTKLLDMWRDGLQPDHRIWTCIVRAASLSEDINDCSVLLNSLSDTGFNLPLRLLKEKSDDLIREVDGLLEQLEPLEDNAAFNFVNALEDMLWAFERRAIASWIFQLALKKKIYRHDVFRVAEKDWGADFRKLSAGAALVALTLWLDCMQDASLQGNPESPKSVVLITGTAEYNKVSLNNTLKAYLWEMGSPFLPCRTRSGVLVAKAHSLRMWLKDSSFCADLELQDAPCLPMSNSMKLIEGYFMRAGLVPAFKDILEQLGHVSPKKFSKLALLSNEMRAKVIKAEIEGKKEKLEKMKKRGIIRARRPTRLRTGRVMRRKHKAHALAMRDS